MRKVVSVVMRVVLRMVLRMIHSEVGVRIVVRKGRIIDFEKFEQFA